MLKRKFDGGNECTFAAATQLIKRQRFRRCRTRTAFIPLAALRSILQDFDHAIDYGVDFGPGRKFDFVIVILRPASIGTQQPAQASPKVLKNGVVYVPTVGKRGGAYVIMAPVAVVPAADTEGLRTMAATVGAALVAALSGLCGSVIPGGHKGRPYEVALDCFVAEPVIGPRDFAQ